MVRDYGGNIVLGWLARMGEGAVFTVYTLYMFSYLTAIVHLQRTAVLASVTAAALVLIFTTPLAAAWSDRVGRAPPVRDRPAGQWLRGVSVVLDAAIRQHECSPRIAIVISIGVLWAPVYGPEAALFCELFDTRVRYTGVSLVYQIGAIMFLAPLPDPRGAAGARGRRPALGAGALRAGRLLRQRTVGEPDAADFWRAGARRGRGGGAGADGVTPWMKSGTWYQPSHRRSRPHQAIRALRSISRARKERYATVAFSYAECYWMTRPTWEFVMMKLRDAAIVGVASIALATAPINPAFARWHGGPGPYSGRSRSERQWWPVPPSSPRRRCGFSGTGYAPPRPIIRPRRPITRPAGLLPAAGLLRAATGLLRSLIGTHQRKVTVALWTLFVC